MHVATRMIGLCALALILSVNPASAADPSENSLVNEFRSPPDSARPRVWWHWMNGNVTEEGIDLDLRWMRRIGIGGVQNFDAAIETPQVVQQRLKFMSPAWAAAFRHAVTLADELGLEFAIASAPGWSVSGGPWVTPENAMKKLVWSETLIEGQTHFVGKLPAPPSTTGPFQNAAWINPIMPGAPPPQGSLPTLYKDIAIIAYRLPDDEVSTQERHPSVSSSAGPVDSRLLWDNDFTTAVRLPFGEHGQPAWIQLQFTRPVTVRSLSLALQGGDVLDNTPLALSYKVAELQCSHDGVHFHTVVNLSNTTDVQQTRAFPATTAQYFRLLLPTPPSVKVPPTFAVFAGEPRREHRIAEFILHVIRKVDHFEQKAGFFLNNGPDWPSSSKVSRRKAVTQVLDLTSRLQPDSTLAWEVPAGHWAVLRLGWSLLGTINFPASPEATGLEVDKFNRVAVIDYLNKYFGRYETILGPALIGQRGIRAMVNDSYEIGPQNWTDALPEEFMRRRGYDLHRWLPALTGSIIDDAEQTDRFLWDFRRTLGELIADDYYGQVATSLRKRGILHYGESHELGRAFYGDGMDVKREDDVPMGAMWAEDSLVPRTQSDADLRESASVAHIYGQNLVAAESFTALGSADTAFTFSPAKLKPTADREMLNGVNRFVIHTSVHQPLADKAPGLTLGPFGQWFTRHETWAEQATPWIDYLARSSYLLQQGHFVADVVYYYGENSNITASYADHLPPVPEGFAFDFASPHALTKLSLRDGLLVTDSGMRYRVLVLDPRARLMSLDVLKQVARLVSQGATVIGDRPRATPSLADNPNTFRAMINTIWGSSRHGKHPYGLGFVISGESLQKTFSHLSLKPDFSYSDSPVQSSIGFVHRKTAIGDIYFVANRRARSEQFDAHFRIAGLTPELWHADSGLIEPTSYHTSGDETIIPLSLAANDAVFVVFRQPTHERERVLPQPRRERLLQMNGPWQVHFQPGLGAPDQAVFSQLKSWSDQDDPGIRYFSGTATYQTAFSVAPGSLNTGRRIELDLGEIKEIAEVLVNGTPAGMLWKTPYRLDITPLLNSGVNQLTVRITNLWRNRLIGDKQPGATAIASTSLNPYRAESPLLESGLLGPVTLSIESRTASDKELHR